MRLNTCRYINQESAQFADTHIFSLIITQPTNALIVCHLFLNNFLKHFHCSYMFRYVYVLHLYGQTIRQLCTAPVWADNQTNVYVLHLYGQTIRQLCTASVWADNQTTVYCICMGNQTTVYCTCMGRQSDNCVLHLYGQTIRQLCIAKLSLAPVCRTQNVYSSLLSLVTDKTVCQCCTHTASIIMLHKTTGQGYTVNWTRTTQVTSRWMPFHCTPPHNTAVETNKKCPSHPQITQYRTTTVIHSPDSGKQIPTFRSAWSANSSWTV